MLPLIGLSLAAVFFVLYFSGVLEDLAGRARRTRRANDHGGQRSQKGIPSQDEARRLEVFEKFLNRLPRPPKSPGDGE